MNVCRHCTNDGLLEKSTVPLALHAHRWNTCRCTNDGLLEKPTSCSISTPCPQVERARVVVQTTYSGRRPLFHQHPCPQVERARVVVQTTYSGRRPLFHQHPCPQVERARVTVQTTDSLRSPLFHQHSMPTGGTRTQVAGASESACAPDWTTPLCQSKSAGNTSGPISTCIFMNLSLERLVL